MATGDKLVNLDSAKMIYDDLRGDLGAMVPVPVAQTYTELAGKWFRTGTSTVNYISDIIGDASSAYASTWRVGYAAAEPGKTYKFTFYRGGSERHHMFFSGDNVSENKEYNITYAFGPVAAGDGQSYTGTATAPTGTTKIWVASKCTEEEKAEKLCIWELVDSDAFTRIAQLEEEVADSNTEIDELETRMAEAEDGVSTLSTGLSTTEGNVTALGTRMTAAEGNITTLKNLYNSFRNGVYTKALTDNGYQAGYVVETTGGLRSSDTKHLYSDMMMVYGPVRIVAPAGYLVSVVEYYRLVSGPGTSSYLGSLAVDADPAALFVAPSNVPGYIIVGLKRVDDEDMGSSDITAANNGVKMLAIEQQPLFAGPSMFTTWGITGCSWDAGTVYGTDAGQVTLNGMGWAENVSRRNGMDLTNYAIGGTSIRTWYNWEPTSGQPDRAMKKLLADNALGLYVLVFGGTNDRNDTVGFVANDSSYSASTPSTTTYYVGTLEDITLREGEGHSYAEYPCTFYGYYGRIIEMIKAHAPRSKIIVTSPNTRPAANAIDRALTAACQEIAQHYELPYMDIREDPYYPVYISTLSGGSPGHPTSVTYSGWAMAFERLFAKCAENNYEYFRKWSNDPTTVSVSWEKVEL